MTFLHLILKELDDATEAGHRSGYLYETRDLITMS